MTTFRELLKRGEPLFGLYMQSGDPLVVELAKAAGFDFIRVDNEHILYNPGQLRDIIRVAVLLDMPCQVRVSSLEDVTKLLDAGATGIVIPDVNTLERAQKGVSAVKFHPLGSRGMYPVAPPVGRYLRAAGHDTFAEYVKAANDIVTLTVQVEDVRAADCLDDMLTLEGVDMVSSGKGDISQSIGFPGQINHPEVVAFEELLVRKALEHGKQPALMARSPEYVKKMAALGVRVFTCGPDEVIFANSLKNFMEQYRG